MRRFVFLWVLAVGFAGQRAAWTAPEKVDPEALRQAVEKDCRTFKAYLLTKRSHIRDALSLGSKPEATKVAEALHDEEVRALRRLAWYLGTDKSNKDRVAKLTELVEQIKGMSGEDYEKRVSDPKFALPPWIDDPFKCDLGGEGGDAAPSPEPSGKKK